jgi:hypothetical protein
MHVAVKDLVEQREAFGLGHAQADLNQRSAPDLFLVVSGLGQGTMAAIEVGVGNIINDPRRSEPILPADLFKESPLPSFGVQGFQAIQRAHQALLGQALQVQQEVQVGTLKPTRHVVETPIVQTVGIHQTENFLAIGSQLVRQLDFLGQMVQHQQWAIQFDLFHLDLRHRGGQDGASVGFLTDIANESLNHLAADPPVFDLGQIDFPSLFEFTDEAHVVINIITTL